MSAKTTPLAALAVLDLAIAAGVEGATDARASVAELIEASTHAVCDHSTALGIRKTLMAALKRTWGAA